jgi:hypothetical protein
MSKRWVDLITNGTRRPQRYAISLPVQFRTLDDAAWQEGRSENISRSGILFRAPHPLDVDAVIEMMFDLPAEMGGEPGAHVVCIAHIARVLPRATPEEPPLLAARIHDYRFVRGAADDVEG